MKNLPFKLKLFLFSSYAFTIASLFLFFQYKLLPLKVTSIENILFFSILIILTETFTFYFKNISFSTSFAVQLAVFILFGPLTTIVITILGFSFRILKANGKYKHIFNTPYFGTLSNYCNFIIIILYGSFFYKIFGGEIPIGIIGSITKNLIPLIAFCIAFYVINVLIISILYSIMSNKSFIYCFISNIKLGILNIIIMAPFGLAVVLIFGTYTYMGVLLFIFPIVLARYTFSLYIEAKSKYVETIDVLMHAMEARDPYTQGHTKRVGELASTIAAELKYNQWKTDELYMAALLHDVGKMGIEDSILKKPGKLTEEEFMKIKSHPEIGDNILKDIKDSEKIRFIVRHHHERYDGTGYPDKKKPEELNLDVYIIQLADCIDAMSTDRPYRNALTEVQVLNEVKNNRGTQFHPDVVDAYLRINEKRKKR